MPSFLIEAPFNVGQATTSCSANREISYEVEATESRPNPFLAPLPKSMLRSGGTAVMTISPSNYSSLRTPDQLQSTPKPAKGLASGNVLGTRGGEYQMNQPDIKGNVPANGSSIKFPNAGIVSGRMPSSESTHSANRESWRNDTGSNNTSIKGNGEDFYGASRSNGYLYTSAHGEDPHATQHNSSSQIGTASTTPGTSDFLAATSTSHSNARFSSPPALSAGISASLPPSNNSTSPPFQGSLRQRHTLQVPAPKGHTSRNSITSTSDAALTTGRFSPTTAVTPRRASMSIGRRGTRSMQSDAHDEIPQDEDAARVTNEIIAKRASKRRKKEEDEEDDKVVVGTKVDINHVNWVTAYNMLTGIRFVVSAIYISSRFFFAY